MATNILLLPQLSGAFVTATNSDWTYVLPFVQAAPNTGALDLSGIVFSGTVRVSADLTDLVPRIRLLSGDGVSAAGNGFLVNGGAAGTLTWRVPAATMALLAPGAFVTDLVAQADGYQINLFRDVGGSVSLTHAPGVTR